MVRKTLGQAHAFSFTCLRTSSFLFWRFNKCLVYFKAVATGHCCPSTEATTGDNVWSKWQETCLNLKSSGNSSFCYLVTIILLQQERFFWAPGCIFQPMCYTKHLHVMSNMFTSSENTETFPSGTMPKAVLSKQLSFKNWDQTDLFNRKCFMFFNWAIFFPS